jgi:serine/threonine-protein kinase HipA
MVFQMMNKVSILEIWLGQTLVGYLSGFQGGKNTFTFDEHYINLEKDRPTLSLSFLDDKQLKLPYVSNQALPSFFSNLLPEGDYRSYILNLLKLKSSDEFKLFKALSGDCPGNIIVKSEDILHNNTITINSEPPTEIKKSSIRFSLAGVQLKFSLRMKNGRYTIASGHPGNVIVKMPSSIYPHLPENEFSMMQLAKAVGIIIPEIQLIPLKTFEDSINIKHLNNQLAYVIQRFDRFGQDGRIHCEDFAQALGIRPFRKYEAANHETIARIIIALFPNGMIQLEQFLTRVFLNILIGNTDAHLKNWSICFEDGKHPSLAPAYDIVSTLEYLDNQELALNFCKIKNFYEITENTLVKFAERINTDKRFILNIAEKVVTNANELWPQLLRELPISIHSRNALRLHWKKLKNPFKLSSLVEFL